MAANSTVKLAVNQDGEKFALKIFDYDKPEQVKVVERMKLMEQKLKGLDHPNIGKIVNFNAESQQF